MVPYRKIYLKHHGFIPKDNYMSVLYLSYTGDLPPYPPKKDISLKIKLRTKNHLLVKGTKTEVIKITNNLFIIFFDLMVR